MDIWCIKWRPSVASNALPIHWRRYMHTHTHIHAREWYIKQIVKSPSSLFETSKVWVHTRRCVRMPRTHTHTQPDFYTRWMMICCLREFLVICGTLTATHLHSAWWRCDGGVIFPNCWAEKAFCSNCCLHTHLCIKCSRQCMRTYVRVCVWLLKCNCAYTGVCVCECVSNALYDVIMIRVPVHQPRNWGLCDFLPH